jgi:hypothetical protein
MLNLGREALEAINMSRRMRLKRSRLLKHAVLVAVAVALLALTALGASSAGAAGKPPKCKRSQAARKHRGCPASTKPKVSVVTRHFQIAVPHSGALEGLSEVKAVYCPLNGEVFGGGAEVTAPNMSIVLSAPNEATDGWLAQVANLSSSTDAYAALTVYAICVGPSS